MCQCVCVWGGGGGLCAGVSVGGWVGGTCQCVCTSVHVCRLQYAGMCVLVCVAYVPVCMHRCKCVFGYVLVCTGVSACLAMCQCVCTGVCRLCGCRVQGILCLHVIF